MIELPKDAEGREIPLDTRRLYDKNGKRKTVLWFEYSPTLKRWTVVPDEGLNGVISVMSASRFYLTPPDSWEKLLEDLGRGVKSVNYGACKYFGKGGVGACSSCIADKNESCEQAVYADIASRIRKLRGEDR